MKLLAILASVILASAAQAANKPLLRDDSISIKYENILKIASSEVVLNTQLPGNRELYETEKTALADAEKTGFRAIADEIINQVLATSSERFAVRGLTVLAKTLSKVSGHRNLPVTIQEVSFEVYGATDAKAFGWMIIEVQYITDRFSGNLTAVRTTLSKPRKSFRPRYLFSRKDLRESLLDDGATTKTSTFMLTNVRNEGIMKIKR